MSLLAPPLRANRRALVILGSTALVFSVYFIRYYSTQMWPPTAPRPLPPSEYRVHKFPEGRVFYCSTAEPEPELLPYCCRLVDATLHRGWDCENTYWGPYVTTSGDKLYRCPSGSKSGDPTPACCEPALYHQVNAELEQCDEQRLIKPLFAEIIPHGIGEAIG